MEIINFVFITDQQKRSEKAENIAKQIQMLLNIDTDASISTYPKFEHSFKIELHKTLNGPVAIKQLIELSDRICSPWLIYYDRDTEKAELIFNRTEHCRFSRQQFNVIKWAHISMV